MEEQYHLLPPETKNFLLTQEEELIMSAFLQAAKSVSILPKTQPSLEEVVEKMPVEKRMALSEIRLTQITEMEGGEIKLTAGITQQQALITLLSETKCFIYRNHQEPSSLLSHADTVKMTLLRAKEAIPATIGLKRKEICLPPFLSAIVASHQGHFRTDTMQYDPLAHEVVIEVNKQDSLIEKIAIATLFNDYYWNSAVYNAKEDKVRVIAPAACFKQPEEAINWAKAHISELQNSLTNPLLFTAKKPMTIESTSSPNWTNKPGITNKKRKLEQIKTTKSQHAKQRVAEVNFPLTDYTNRLFSEKPSTEPGERNYSQLGSSRF